MGLHIFWESRVMGVCFGGPNWIDVSFGGLNWWSELVVRFDPFLHVST